MTAHVVSDEQREPFPVERIELMVKTFYGSVREDPELGPIFERRVSDWPHHLGRMVSFWRAVLRSEPTFRVSERGSPPALHRGIEELERRHFDRWLDLFARTVQDVFAPEEARHVLRAAQRIAVALSGHLAPGAVR